MGLASWVERVWADPERRARAFRTWWLVSVGMTALGYLLIAKHYAGRLSWPLSP